jgi:hypothetical protein
LGSLCALPELAALDLSGIMRVTDAGMLELQSATSLTDLNIGGCFVTAAGVGLLQQRLPHLRITYHTRSPVFTWATEGCHHQAPPAAAPHSLPPHS